MKIFVDIGHPAHVHYFKNFINLMQDKGHEFCISARNKDCAVGLLDAYGLNYFHRGNGAVGLFNKFLYLVKADFLLYQNAVRFKPDLFLSFGSSYAAHTSKLMRKPHIALDDTEIAKFEHILYVPFTDFICTPYNFEKDFGEKQFRFKSFVEMTYLHPNYFEPDNSILKELGVSKTDKFFLFRFVSWHASHDFGQKRFTLADKKKLLQELQKYGTVFVSAEGEIPEEFREFQIEVPPEKIHDVLAFATLYVGEGATMASECAMIGTPAIYVNSLRAGTIEAQKDYGLLYQLTNVNTVLQKARELLQNPKLKQDWKKKRAKMLDEQIDLTALLVWLVENYPKSAEILKKDPDYQFNFK